MVTYPLSFPAVGVSSSAFRLRRIVGVSESPFTAAQQLYKHPGEYWEGEVTFPPLLGDNAGAVRAFLAQLRGRSGTFLYGDPDNLAKGNRGAGTFEALAGKNWVRNSVAAGATVGVVGAGGALPTNWAVQIAAGLATEIISTGTASNGLPYVRVKISGTPSGTVYRLRLEALNTISGVAGGSWSASFYHALAAGSLSNLTCACRVTEQDSGGAVLADFGQTAFTPTAALARVSHSRVLANASCAYTCAMLALSLTVGQAVNITLDIGGAQLENRSVTTTLIQTTGSAVVRPGGVTVVGAGQTGNQLLVQGWTAAANVLKRGDFFSLGTGDAARLHMITEDVSTDLYGKCTLDFEPALRTSPADEAALTVTGAKGAFRLADNAAEWGSGTSCAQQITLAFREAL